MDFPDFRGWLQDWLGISDLHEQVLELDDRMGQIEALIGSMLQHFGKYKTRTKQELDLMKSQLETMLETVSNVVLAVENLADRQSAASLRYRLKHNLARINTALDKSTAAAST